MHAHRSFKALFTKECGTLSEPDPIALFFRKSSAILHLPSVRKSTLRSKQICESLNPKSMHRAAIFLPISCQPTPAPYNYDTCNWTVKSRRPSRFTLHSGASPRHTSPQTHCLVKN